MSILNGTLKTKAYKNYIKRTLIILKYRYLKIPTGLYLKNLNNYSNVTEYGSLIRRASQYYKYYTMSLTKTTIRNSQIQKFNYILIMKEPLIYILSTIVLNYIY